MGKSSDDQLAADDLSRARRSMLREQLAGRGVRDPATLAAMALVPRDRFVPRDRHQHAYSDVAMSIGRGQTISQPYMVARMTESLGLADLDWPWMNGGPSFLDVGTGSGYQAAILAQLGGQVTSIELDPTLAQGARERLRQLGYEIEVINADGSAGYPQNAPYSGILVAAGAPTVPIPLVEQLADRGRLVIPVGSRTEQRLTVVHKTGDRVDTRELEACVFVPLLGAHGHPA